MYSNHGWSYSTFSSRSPGPERSAYRRRPAGRRLGGALRGVLGALTIGVARRVGPLPLAVLVVAAAGWYHFLFAGFALEGTVRDRASGESIGGARVSGGGGDAVTGADGVFHLAGVKPPEPLLVDAPGYSSETVRVVLPTQPVVAALDPKVLELLVTDAETGLPIEGATARGSEPATGLGGGRFRLAPVRPREQLVVEAAGYAPWGLAYDGQASLEVALPPVLSGQVADGRSGQPVQGVRVAYDGGVATTDAQGRYSLPSRPAASGKLVSLAPGYKPARLEAGHAPGLDLQLEPNEVRALYMTYFAIADPGYRREMYRLLDTTELNAVVLDVKGDYGLLAYRSQVPLASQIGANDRPTIDDVDELLGSLHQRGVYVIARIVAFKDDLLARNGPRAGVDVAVKDRRTGQPWLDREHLGWVDAFQPAAQEYNVALAREAIERGFDEVQFDYVRFATDAPAGGSIEDTQYSKPFTEANRVGALKSFLDQAHRAVNEAGGFLAIDTFGYTTWWDDDGGIGQDLNVLADYVDYFCPMVYPSTFDAGVPGLIPYPAVVRNPYEVVYESLKHAREKLAGKRVVVRPWLQYFDDYPWATNTRYEGPQIERQKQAVVDSKALGWMLWNPGSKFDRGGLAPRS